MRGGVNRFVQQARDRSGRAASRGRARDRNGSGRSLASGKAIADKTEEFRPADTIYLSVETDGTSPKTTLTAHWTYQDGQVVKEQSETIAPAGKASTEFHIEKPGGWPAGKYAVKVSLDGAAAGGKDFVVK